MHMLCNINPKPWLTFPFEFSSMIHPIGFGFSAGVSPHMQPISIQVLTLEHQSNLTPCQFDWRRHFNPNTMSDLKTPMNVWCIKHDNWSIGSTEAWLNFIQREIGMSTNLVCLMSKAGHWSTYYDGLLMKAQCYHHDNSSIFFLFFLLWSKKRERTLIPR